MLKRYLLILGILSTLLLWGCSEDKKLAVGGSVEANEAYLEYFGQPPAVQKGTAYARVVFLPFRNDPTKLEAAPVYLVEKENQIQHILDRLTSGKLILPPQSPLYQPLTQLKQVKVSANVNGTITLAIEPPLEDQAILTTLVETVLQFPEIKYVKILVDGKPFESMPEQGFSAVSGLNIQVSPPEALMIAGMWEHGEPTLHEIYVDFNRPVTVNKFQLYNAAGQQIAGEKFISAFKMAVVIQPKNPEQFKAGDILKAEWDITDAIGRINRGVTVMPLAHYEH